MSDPNQPIASGSEILPKQVGPPDPKGQPHQNSNESPESLPQSETCLKENEPPDPKEQHLQNSNECPGSATPGDNMNTDDDDEEPHSLFLDDKSLRNPFVRKVFAILTLQLIDELVIVCIFYYTPSVKDHVSKWRLTFLITSSGIFIVVAGTLFAAKNLIRSFPRNIISLIVETISIGFFLGAFAVAAESDAIIRAMVMAIAIIVILIIFTFQTFIKLTTLPGALLIFLLSFSSYVIEYVIFKIDHVTNFLTVLWSGCFCFYVHADMHYIMDGHHPMKIMPEEVVFGTLTLYMDYFYDSV